MRQHHRPLAQVVQHQRRQHQREPGQHDRPPPEMAKVRVQGLAPRHCQEDRAQDQKGHARMLKQEACSPDRAERAQDCRLIRDVPQPQPRQRHEPDHADRPEKCRHAGCPAPLHEEQRHQNAQRDRDHIGRKCRQDQPQPLDRRQDRDRRRDRRVAREKRRARQCQDQDRHRPAARRKTHQSVKRQDAALAPVVGPQQDEDVLDRHDQDQRPDQQGQDAQHLGHSGHRRPRRLQRLAEGIDRRGADVAVNHPDRPQRQGCHALPVGLIGVDVIHRRLGLQVVGDVQRLGVEQRQGRLNVPRNRVVNHGAPLGVCW